jgi:carboxyl-terminal processing protease
MSKKLPAALVFVTICVASLVVGIRATSGGTLSSRLSTLTEILALIEERHVPPAESRELVYSGIRGMLGTLDPHSNFLDEEAFREMREEQRGSFYGLGIVISKRGRNQPLRVVSPISNTPAARLGIRAGDVINHIRDPRAGVDVDTLGLTIQEAVKYLRGPRGTVVEVTIDRPGLEQPIVLEVRRDAVRTPAVNLAFMVRPGVGFIQISNFTETTTRELDAALERLRKEGAERLVLDLRQNPGGLLKQAINVASRFLDPGELVVYTEGRLSGSRQEYDSLEDVPSRIDWPVVVILDRGSASASEIVAGAIQDHDRGIVVGETSFGKGLVQSVYPLSENAALALTTQKYYTPVGRSIQRPYSSEEEYYYEAQARESTIDVPEDAPVYRTETGRTVHGGGGIRPDVIVSREEDPRILFELSRQSAYTRFLARYDEAERERFVENLDALFESFVGFLKEKIPEVDASDVREHSERVSLYLRGELALTRSGMRARDRVLAEASPVVHRALDAFDQAEELLARREEVRSQRAQRDDAGEAGSHS